MKEEKTNYHPLFVTALLICAGLISPSNGVDDKIYKTPTNILGIIVVAIAAGLIAFSILKFADQYGFLSNKSKQNRKPTN